MSQKDIRKSLRIEITSFDGDVANADLLAGCYRVGTIQFHTGPRERGLMRKAIRALRFLGLPVIFPPWAPESTESDGNFNVAKIKPGTRLQYLNYSGVCEKVCDWDPEFIKVRLANDAVIIVFRGDFDGSRTGCWIEKF